MRQRIRPCIESLESRSLLSHAGMEIVRNDIRMESHEHIRREAHEHVTRDVRVHISTSGHGSKGMTALLATENASSSANASIGAAATGTIGSTATGTASPPALGIPSPALAMSLTTNQSTYTAGESVRMTFQETNNTDHAVRVPIGPNIDGFTIMSGGKTIWISNSGIEPDVIYLDVLAPGESITLTANWTASSRAGTYVAHNELAFAGPSAAFAIVAS